MINPAEKEQIIEILGLQYSRKILPYLKMKNCFNKKGNPYTPRVIQSVINGEVENTIIETHIFKLIASIKAKKQELENLKKQTL